MEIVMIDGLSNGMGFTVMIERGTLSVETDIILLLYVRCMSNVIWRV